MLEQYADKAIPLVLNGARKNVDLFSKNYSQKAVIAGKIRGNYQHSFYELAASAWDLVYKYQLDKGKQMIDELREKIGQGRGVSGLKPVWKAVHEGRGLVMLVEKDYQVPGFITKDGDHLYLRAPAKEHIVVPDLVDMLSKKMIHKKDKLFFVENGSLEAFGHIALITRY